MHKSGAFKPPLAPPLWRQLLATAQVIERVSAGQSGSAALAMVEGPLRPGVQALSFSVWRNLGHAQAWRAALVPRKPSPLVDALLCTALALLTRPEQPDYDPHTLVNQAVEAAKNNPATRHQAALVNACLRRLLRERSALEPPVQAQARAQWNHPEWWIERLQHDWPAHWQDLLGAANQPPPLTLRVNSRQIAPSDYLQALAHDGLQATWLGGQAIALHSPCPVERLPGFAQGWVSVQDEAAQRAAPLLLAGLSPAPMRQRLRILDACAAPGGKTAHLLELAEADVLALELDPLRASRIQHSLQRLHLKADICTADAGDLGAWWNGQTFDGVLLDAPCSASGIVRRHPDIRWLRRPSDIDTLARTQARLLHQLWAVIRPGGRLLYATCSVFKAEGQEVIAPFLATHADAAALSAPGHLLPTNPGRAGDLVENPPYQHDGFYYALLQKLPA
jgi:16S rRNA (cytosine967-C5)-methyltransferase